VHMHKEEPMKRIISTLMMASAALAVGLALMPPNAAAKKPSGDVTVNCDAGQSIQAALNKAQSSAEPLVINVTGTCYEIVTISRDKAGAVIGPSQTGWGATVNVNGGVDNIHIRGLHIGGGHVGVTVRGGNTWISDSQISGNPVGGLFVLRNSRVAITGTRVENNGSVGVRVEASVFESKLDSEIIDNRPFGLEDSVSGLEAELGAIVIMQDTKISGNEGDGISLDLHSVADLRFGSEVSGNLGFGVVLEGDSALRIRDDTATVSGGIECEDVESSFVNYGGEVTGAVNCTDFGQVVPATE